jgi:hypothetical protein
MSLHTGTATFSRFKVAGPPVRMFDEEFLARLRMHAVSKEKRSRISIDRHKIGWAGGSHIWDDVFDLEKNILGDFLTFDFWHETDQLPADRLKAYYETDLKAITRNNKEGKKATSRQRKEARESAKEQLEQEARDGRFKRWKVFPVIWDSIKQELMLGTTSTSEMDRFMLLFQQTFERNLIGQPNELASYATHINAATLAKRIDWGSKSLGLTPFVKGGSEECRWSANDAYPFFLGNEFVLWLMFRTMTIDDETVVGDESKVAVFFSGGVKLDHPERKDNDTLNSDSAIRTPQARDALRAGYLPRKAALTLARHNKQYTFKLQAEQFGISSLSLPKIDGETVVPRERMIERYELLRDFNETFDLLYQQFVKLRTTNGPAWEAEADEIRDWIQKASSNRKKVKKGDGEEKHHEGR